MSNAIKNQGEILQKLGIGQLNEMQQAAQAAIHAQAEVILLSPTGTGKTLAFLLPIIQSLRADNTEIQALIIVPARELAMQIEQVVKEMGTGFKTNAVYGGHTRSRDKINIKHRPAILIGTPGRVADHLRRNNFSTDSIQHLVLDEFDKSLEIGFEKEMKEIIESLPNLKKKVLTSATEGVVIPHFLEVNAPHYLKFLDKGKAALAIKSIHSPQKDKLDTLLKALCHLGNQPGIIFCNFKDSIQRVSDFLHQHRIAHGCFHGSMEQKDREESLLKFRNGTHQLLLATDLAARGIDVPEIKFILHYHLPNRAQEFTHRNGRTARMNQEGTAYVLQWEKETLPDFIPNAAIEVLRDAPPPAPSDWQTVHLSAGRRDKVSKGDIAGFFFKIGHLKKEDFGVIELKQDAAYVGVKKGVIKRLLSKVNNERLKKKRVRVRLV